MAQQTTTDDRTSIQTPAENAHVTVHLAVNTAATDHGAVNRGAPIADHPAADDSAYVEGRLVTQYSDTKYLLETELGYQLVVQKNSTHDAVVRDFESGEELGRPVYQVATTEDDLPEDTEDYDSEDWDVANDLDEGEHHYVSTTGSIVRHCHACEYEGTHDHPVRSAPTFHATLRHTCPNADCGRTLTGGPAEDCEDCEQGSSEDDDPDGGEGGEAEVATDGGQELGSALEAEREMVAENSQQPQEAEAENPHQHTSTWDAATNLEAHEDGSAPRVGVEYHQKNGNGTSRFSGEVVAVQVLAPDQYGSEVDHRTPQIQFRRDDGHLMWVRGDELHTQGSHHSLVGRVATLTTSTTSTVAKPTPPEDALLRAAVVAEKHGLGNGAAHSGEARMEAISAGLDRLEELEGEDAATEQAGDLLELVQQRTGWGQ